ncbi:MAG: chemotaxis protein CheB [Janthinobacterium lividum]
MTLSHSDPAYVVTIGASAGGLNALSVILAALPQDFPAPVLVVQHLSPDFPSKMVHILGRLTSLPVKEAEEGDCIQAGHVYVAPPAKHLLVNPDLTLSLSLSPKVHHCRPSVDVLFRSAAISCGTSAIGVVLTGGDGDGSAGIHAIKAAGGITMAQDLPSSEQPSMPRSAAATGNVDYVLPLSEIAAALVALVSSNESSASSRDGSSEGSDRGTRAEQTPTLLDKAVADLAVCGEALRVAEEALRVQSDVITSYILALKAEAKARPAIKVIPTILPS